MRIISGKLKGRRLLSFKANNIRPTTDRVKESIFGKIQFEMDGANVLDLFSGTGNLSFESYSRGAQKVTAVESNSKSIKIIKDNKAHLKLNDEIQIIKKDVFKYIEDASDTFDIVFADPPFTQKIAHEVMECLAKFPKNKKGGWVIIESQAQERIDDDYGPYKLLDRKEFGDKRVSFFTYEVS